MADRTTIVLAALGKQGALEVALHLLEHPGGCSVADVLAGGDLSQATVSRRLHELELAGMVDHRGRKKPFRLVAPDETAQLIASAASLAKETLSTDLHATEALQERIEARPKADRS